MSTEIEETTKVKNKRPSQYQVVLLNDNYTTVDFVVSTLISIFQKTSTEAQLIAETIHKEGKGIVGVFSYEIAKTKVMMLEEYSKNNNFPLKAIVEKTNDR